MELTAEEKTPYIRQKFNNRVDVVAAERWGSGKLNFFCTFNINSLNQNLIVLIFAKKKSPTKSGVELERVQSLLFMFPFKFLRKFKSIADE